MPNNPQANGRARKRKRRSALESELDEVDYAKDIQCKLEKIARDNEFSDGEMKRLLSKLIKNEHILALVTLKAEDEVAKEKESKDEPAVIITENPSVPKLTRAKARELKREPGIALPSLANDNRLEIAKLIRDDLNSDEEDEEYTFKEEDFVSDDDPNTGISDLDSNPRTPMTPVSQTDLSPIKYTADGCFKVPVDKKNCNEEDLLIATRTRSKFCLQQTPIEELESEFIPPDVEQPDLTDIETTAPDEDWMQFLYDFSKPLNSSIVTDDDDPVNDPEYVAAEKVPVDAEELRDVNISKKELADLVAELFEGMLNEDISFESVNLETPEKFISNFTDTHNFEQNRQILNESTANENTQICVSDSTISSSNMNYTELNYNSLQADSEAIVMHQYGESPAKSFCKTTTQLAETVNKINPEFIVVPTRGQQNSYQLAKIVNGESMGEQTFILNDSSVIHAQEVGENDNRSHLPYDANFSCEYVSIKRHIYSEYRTKFENMRNCVKNSTNQLSEERIGFTTFQYQLLQQQLRLHIQFLAQTFLQTYSHPDLWEMAPKCKEMLLDLEDRSKSHNMFKSENLMEGIELIKQWELELSEDTDENKELMNFIYAEIEKTSKNARQIARFPPRMMDAMLNSKVVVYPQYLPRIPFTSKKVSYASFSPSESHLIAMGLEKHLNQMWISGENIPANISPYRLVCGRLCIDTIQGKTKRRIWDHIKYLQKAPYYNPIKYYFEHGYAPPMDNNLMPFDPTEILAPKNRYLELPTVWQKYLKSKEKPYAKSININGVRVVDNLDSSISQSNGTAINETIHSKIANAEDIETKPNHDAIIKNIERNQHTVLNVSVNYVFGDNTIYQKPQGEELTLKEFSHNDAKLLNESINNVSDPTKLNVLFQSNESLSTISNKKCTCDTRRTSTIWKRRKSRKVRRRFARRMRRINALRAHKLLNTDRKSRKLKERCAILLSNYAKYLHDQLSVYKQTKIVNQYYRYIKTLELYTEFLEDLKEFCHLNMNGAGSNTNSNSPINSINRRTRLSTYQVIDEDGTVSSKAKRLSRQEESLRQMLLPDTAEETNRKDAIFAFNFYEEVEIALRSSNRPDDFDKFTDILRSFNPHTEKVCDLYRKLEQIFLPDHPELAEVFLSFLLPTEAAEIGKFFEHFMINNMTSFINKLNIYFNKQPAQIRKIYNCLNELAETPGVTMNQVEAKILPLLKGNQFLVEWFLQQFAESKPPESLLPAPEHINIKEVQNSSERDVIETVTDLLDSPTNDSQQGCQLRYINGRIFYGTKVTLPAKLSFMAEDYCETTLPEVPTSEEEIGATCVHGIQEQGERQLTSANSAVTDANNDEIDPIEEENLIKIDSTSGEEDTVEVCDYNTLRSHAIRLNPQYYGNICAVQTAPNPTLNQPQIKRCGTLNLEDKQSPKKQPPLNVATCSSSPSSSSMALQLKDKRKSPTKKNKSPLCTSKPRLHMPPMVVIHEQSAAISCAKKLKSLIEDDEEDENDIITDAQNGVHIVARTKDSLKYDPTYMNASSPGQYENDTDLVENQHEAVSSTNMDSDEDSKFDITNSFTHNQTTDEMCSTVTELHCSSLKEYASRTIWTREEDKVILIEMKMGSQCKGDLLHRIRAKLPNRTLPEIELRHQFLMDFLSKLQKK